MLLQGQTHFDSSVHEKGAEAKEVNAICATIQYIVVHLESKPLHQPVLLISIAVLSRRTYRQQIESYQ